MRRLLFVLWLVAGCAGAPPRTQTSTESAIVRYAPQAATETVATQEIAPLTEESTRSFVTEAHRYVMRIDLAKVRASPLAPDVRRVLAQLPEWQRFLAESGVDPIEQIDEIVFASPARGSTAWIALFHHRGTDAQLREATGRIAAARGLDATWREEGGVAYAAWPGVDDGSQLIVRISEGWAALTPRSELARVLVVGARAESAEVVEGEALRDIHGFPEAARLTARTRPAAERLEFSPLTYFFTIDDDAGGGVVASWRGEYETESDVAAAEAHWDAQRNEYAANPILRLTGLSAPIVAGRWVREGTSLSFALHVSEQQMRVLLDFATPILVGGRRGR